MDFFLLRFKFSIHLKGIHKFNHYNASKIVVTFLNDYTCCFKNQFSHKK